MAAPRRYKFIRIFNMLLCVFAILLSIYSYYVEISKEADSSFQALCDINAYISCSKAFTSEYGKGFGLLQHVVGKDHWLNQPNTVFGLAFYTILIIMGETHSLPAAVMQTGFASMSIIMSLYLAFILAFILNDFCIVCVTTYILNGLILYCSILKLRYFHSIELKLHRKKAK